MRQILMMSLFMIVGISSALAEDAPLRRGQLYGSALICPLELSPQDCNPTNAREIIKVTCGGVGHGMGIAQMADNESGQALKPNEYIKIVCRIGTPAHERAEKQ